jgi:hypothetical protein
MLGFAMSRLPVSRALELLQTVNPVLRDMLLPAEPAAADCAAQQLSTSSHPRFRSKTNVQGEVVCKQLVPQ